MSILVTGGAGFIGSHTCVELLNAGYDVVVADNLYNASEKSLERVKKITGKDLKFYKADIRDKEAMNEIFEKEEIESVIHFAGLKAVGESVAKPLEYYENNIGGTITLCDVMRNHGVGEAATGSPREILQLGYKIGFIDDAETWLLMLKKRNTSVHIYNEDEVEEMVLLIRDSFIPAFTVLKDTLVKKLEEVESDWV